ncbi:MAG: hypothetical protein JSU79_01670 [Dehalococcoidales bacterium]|nr:MAG: hypothetical protein JSU79_01670 [Dehalococcoidales bacterium]
MPFAEQFEKAGKPSVVIVFEDQDECLKQGALLLGIPHVRTVYCSRIKNGVEDATQIIKPLMDALVRPPTAEEQEGGRWDVPDKRVLFEGTLDEAEEFYERAASVPVLGDAWISLYTDGMAIRIPTEERVQAMLKGTSHKPDEVITLQSDHTPREMGVGGKKGTPVHFEPMKRTATVEKVAINAVMAGCKLEYMPILLAIAEAGGGGGDGRGSLGFCVSGPIAKEIGMNFDVGMLGPGNQANRSIGRAAELMWINLGGNIPKVTSCGIMGNPLFNCFPENSDALPPGWKGVNEEYDFKKDESIVYVIGMRGGPPGSLTFSSTEFSPGRYRTLMKSGSGGMAKRLGVEGIPGPHNWFEYQVDSLWAGKEGGYNFIILPEMAQHLYEAGFKSKDEVYQWLYESSFMPFSEYRKHASPDFRTGGWRGVEKTSGKPWKELPDDYMVPAVDDPYQNCIIVSGGGEETSHWVNGRTPNADPAYGIDVWR